MALTRIGVVGVGNIGTSLVTDLVLHGLHVVGVDLTAENLQTAQENVLNFVRSVPLMSKTLPRISRDQALERMTLSTQLEDVATCDFIIENVTEDWTVKEPVYKALDRIARPGVCFGANTSCIPITRIGGATRRPEHVIGLHLMNPVPLKPTVEVIRSAHTSDQTLATLLELFSVLGKDAIVVGDMPGFVSNRISHLFMNEAAFALQDDVASADNIDRIFRQCFGHKMGPLETADLIGLDTVMRSLDVLYESFGDPKYRCCPLLRRLVHEGHLGRKTGVGSSRVDLQACKLEYSIVSPK